VGGNLVPGLCALKIKNLKHFNLFFLAKVFSKKILNLQNTIEIMSAWGTKSII